MALTVPWTVAIVNTVYPVQWIQENVQLVARKDGLEHTVQVKVDYLHIYYRLKSKVCILYLRCQ